MVLFQAIDENHVSLGFISQSQRSCNVDILSEGENPTNAGSTYGRCFRRQEALRVTADSSSVIVAPLRSSRTDTRYCWGLMLYNVLDEEGNDSEKSSLHSHYGEIGACW